MDKLTHTPGNWILMDAGRLGLFVLPDDGTLAATPICTIEQHAKLPVESAANARIIAAIPQLLEALVNLASDSQLFYHFWDFGFYTYEDGRRLVWMDEDDQEAPADAVNDAVRRAVKVIAEATGVDHAALDDAMDLRAAFAKLKAT